MYASWICALCVSIKNASFDGNKYLFPTQSSFYNRKLGVETCFSEMDPLICASTMQCKVCIINFVSIKTMHHLRP